MTMRPKNCVKKILNSDPNTLKYVFEQLKTQVIIQKLLNLSLIDL